MHNNWNGKHGPMLIAEIGGNHSGDFNYAKKLTLLAIQSDVDFVKFQLYRADSLVNAKENFDRHQHFNKFALPIEQYIELAELCKSHNQGFMASVWDLDYLDIIDPYCTIFKVGSGDLTAYPLLQAIVKKKKPIILSTGLSTLNEIIQSIVYIQSLNKLYKTGRYLALLQCTAMYPIESGDANLKVMQTLRRETQLPVGYSDHTEGVEALITATAMEAQILEFHFTDTREQQTFRDHKVSLTLKEVRLLIEKIHSIRTLQGDGKKLPLSSEQEHRSSFRRAIYPNQDIQEEEELTPEKLVCLRPNHGIDARYFDKVIGMRTKQPLKAFQQLDWKILY